MRPTVKRLVNLLLAACAVPLFLSTLTFVVVLITSRVALATPAYVAGGSLVLMVLVALIGVKLKVSTYSYDID
jgi:hypothetical protein